MAALAVPTATQLLGCSSAHAKDDETLVTIADARSGIAQPVDLGAQGDSPGDLFVFDQPLLNEARENIGSNSGYCVRTLPGQFSECQWTLTLADGTITVAGREAETGTSYVPIVGGTGSYQGVRGVLATTPNGDRTFTQVLTIQR
ncbi:dirigent protein [Pyxidicoccus fallax]|uniref:Dirigent protein n=2 Tax=Pyxidicoccus fallax TaxID=394095 RepID=A0A848LMY2_9BACT|nr:dirigent protein [Pyxidicoccus fallax]NPC80194.1 dirigent protein [Pyxidicoccus fallax]